MLETFDTRRAADAPATVTPAYRAEVQAMVAALSEEAEQAAFERACRRELMGETD